MRDLDKFLEKCPKLKAMVEAKRGQPDRVQQLMEGLSTATTIAQIRAVAKSILNETEGDAV